MEIVRLFHPYSSPCFYLFLEKNLQLYHVLINFEPEKAKNLQTLGVVLKVRVILEWNSWDFALNSELWPRQWLS